MQDDFAAERMAAAEFAMREADRGGGTVHHDVLAAFEFRGQRQPIVEMLRGGRGIRKPAGWDTPLSLRTQRNSPYADAVLSDGRLRYSYQVNKQGEANATYNEALRRAIRERTPVVHLLETEAGYYLPTWPCFIVDDRPDELAVVIDLAPMVDRRLEPTPDPSPLEREYRLVTQRQRVHQARFRDRVLVAYEDRCSICALRRRGLLDASHIVPDRDPAGLPDVRNGLALCKIHHAAFDQYIFGIRPDHVIELRRDVLEEVDGPMLQHGLQEFHGARLHLPANVRDHPDPTGLERRYEEFRATA